MYPILSFINKPFSPFVEFTQFMVCVTRSVCGGNTWPVAGCMFKLQYFGTAASKLKFVMGTFKVLANLARTVTEPFASLRGKKVTFKPFFSKATMGAASCAAGAGAVGAAPPAPKMSRRPRSPPGAPEATGAGAAPPPPSERSSRSRRSPPPPPPPPPLPPPTAGAAAAGAGCEAGASSRSFKSRRSLPPPAEARAPPDGTSSMDASPTSRLSAPPISLSGTGILSRMPARWVSHSEPRSSKNSHDRCCRSTWRLVSNLLNNFLILSNSLGHLVTSLMRAAATRQWVEEAFSAVGGFLTTS
mmetsp:Transcript_58552/g.130823  ORF Transcript_58552/g.130823 Transcript_58552/m.130823 type:complete len:301 (-) Transcript_58552:1564-2466(-)